MHKSLKSECLCPANPLTAEDARRLIQRHVEHSDTVQMHSAIGFMTPAGRPAARTRPMRRAAANWCRRGASSGRAGHRRRDNRS